jgi:hypothetical protein
LEVSLLRTRLLLLDARLREAHRDLKAIRRRDPFYPICYADRVIARLDDSPDPYVQVKLSGRNGNSAKWTSENVPLGDGAGCLAGAAGGLD